MENTNNLFGSFAEAQKQAVENFANATEKMAKSLNMDLNSDFFKKWYDSQMSFFNQNNGADAHTGMNFFNTWMENQMNMAKEWMNNVQSNFSGMMNNNMNEEMKNAQNNMMNIYNNWMNSMNSAYSEMTKNFSNMSTKENFSSMFNNAEMYMNMFNMWMPMMKSIQDKSFTPDMFKNMLNMDQFKNMMDKMFGMQPDFMKNMMNMNMMTENGKKMMEMNKGMFDTMKNNMMNMMPKGNEMFATMMTNYNNMFNMMNESAAPLMKMMTPGSSKASLEMMNELSNEFAHYQMKNAQMQYMMYTTGMKAMDEVAENIYSKLQKGESMNDFMKVYQEWLNTNDKHFVSLFSTDEYSKMQAELNTLGMKMKRHMDLQMEKMLNNVPVATRSEMDELYKVIHELRKRINTLEKQIDNADEVVTEEAKETKSRKTAKNA
jgi:uncharacterized membrane-anchored protein YhcB (DUF1043 family)